MRKRALIFMLSLLMVCAAAGLPAALAEGDLTLYLVEGEIQTELGDTLELTMGGDRVTLSYGGETADSNVVVTFGQSGVVTSTWNRNQPLFYLVPAGEGSTTVTVTLSDGRSATFTVTVGYADPDEVEVRYDHPDYVGQTLVVEDEHTIDFSGDPYPFYVQALANGNADTVNAEAITFAWSFENNTCGATADDQNRVSVTAAGSAEVTVEALLDGQPTGVTKQFTLIAAWQRADADSLCIKVGDQAITGLRYEYGSDTVDLTYLDENDQTQMTEIALADLVLTYDADNIDYVDPDDMLWVSNNPSVATVEDGVVTFRIELTPGDSAQALLTITNSAHSVAANVQVYVYARSSSTGGDTGDTGSGCGGSSAAVSLLAVTAAAAVLLKKLAIR